jgi:hypothetical protein
MPIISIPKPLREKLGEEAVASLVEMINQFGEEIKDSIIDLAEKRFEVKLTRESSGIRENMTVDFSALREDMAAMENRSEQKLTIEIAGVREDMAAMESRFEQRLTNEIAGVREDMAAMESRFNQRLSGEISEIREVMHSHNTAVIKWMFLFWIGQIGVLLGVLFTFFK